MYNSNTSFIYDICVVGGAALKLGVTLSRDYILLLE